MVAKDGDNDVRIVVKALDGKNDDYADVDNEDERGGIWDDYGVKNNLELL